MVVFVDTFFFFFSDLNLRYAGKDRKSCYCSGFKTGPNGLEVQFHNFITKSAWQDGNRKWEEYHPYL